MLCCRPLTASLLAATLALAGGVALASVDDDTPRTLELGSVVDAKTLEFRTLEGKPVTLADYLPKEEDPEEGAEPVKAPIVVLDFWSISCPVSVGYEARFKALHEAFAAGEEADVLLLAIASNHNEVDRGEAKPYARIQKYVEQNAIPFRVLVDEGNVVADLFAAKTTPHVYVLDREQHLRYIGALDDDPNGKQERPKRKLYVEDAIAALRKGEEVAVPKTKERGCSIKRLPKEASGTGE